MLEWERIEYINGLKQYGEMSEWLKELAWKAGIGETLSGVQIPFSPPNYLSKFIDIENKSIRMKS